MMSKIFWKALKLSPAVLGASLLIANSTQAAEQSSPQIDATQMVSGNPVSMPAANTFVAQQIPTETTAPTNTLEEINRYSGQGNIDPGAEDPMGQVTNVSQLRDVKPSDWAYQALRDLVERYGCIAGYPDGFFRGNRALSRYEFAAGVNACLKQIEKLLPDTANFATRQDLEKLQKLVQEFQAELATLGTRVDKLEARTQFLENHNFSATTKLNAEVVVSLADVFGTNRAVLSNQIAGSRGTESISTILADRVRLNFDTSFTGKDLLRTRLQSRNIASFTRTGTVGAAGDTGTRMTRLGADGDEANADFLSRLYYSFPISSQTKVIVEATGAEYSDDVSNFNPLFQSSGDGSISRFGRFNPIYYQALGGSGVVLNHNFSSALGLSLGYLATAQSGTGVVNSLGSVPGQSSGLFNGGYAALAQLKLKPSDAIDLGLTYVQSYNNANSGLNLSGGTGSTWANQPFGSVATSGNHYGLEGSFRINPAVVISAWGGYSTAIAETGSANFSRGASAEIWNWAVTLGLPDLGKKGNLLGFVFGMPPRAGGNQFRSQADQGTSYHIEGFYRYKINDNISITPGLFVILNPEQNNNNNTEWVGVVRTTFKF